MIVSGSSGSGKTIAAQDIVEEALKKGTAVIVFDPTAQWTGFLSECKDPHMLKLYNKFGMKKKDATAFKGTIHFIDDPHEIIDLQSVIKPGEIHLYIINNLNGKQIDQLVASTIQQIFDAKLPETKKLRLLLVYDEVHRLLPKFGGTGEGFLQLERAAREFRKWGIGLLLVSQILNDFIEEIHANISTEIQLRTKHPGDLTRIKDKYGLKILQLLNTAQTGTAMVQNASYNTGHPYFIDFRPLLHNTTRLDDKELATYKKHQKAIESIEHQLKQLEELKKETSDFSFELKLAKEKLAQGKFKLVEVYLQGLEPKLKTYWKKIGKTPKDLEKQYLNKKYLKQQVEQAKKKRNILLEEERKKETERKKEEEAARKKAAKEALIEPASKKEKPTEKADKKIRQETKEKKKAKK